MNHRKSPDRPLLYLFLLLLCQGAAYAQTDAKKMTELTDTLPYREVPAYPAEYTAETVTARMIDGLGFRFYWATEGLRPEDLAYRPNDVARTTEETIDHIMGLSTIVLNAIKKTPNVRTGEETSALSFTVKRKRTLDMLAEASHILKNGSGKLAEYDLVFQRGENKTTLPFWHNLNGPIADALWHVGQVVSFRRSSGNPLSPNVSMLMGTVRE